MLRIVTDGAADFPKGWDEEFDSSSRSTFLARDPESAANLMTKAKNIFRYADAVPSDLSVSLAINPGSGTVGLGLHPVE